MQFFKTITKLISPWPKVYKWNPIAVGLLSFIGLYVSIHLLLVWGGEPMISNDLALEVGDPMLAVFMAFAAIALKGHRPKDRRFYYSRYWYAVVAAGAIVVNILLIVFDWVQIDDFTPLFVVHFALVPIYAVLVLGVVPILLFGVKGHWISRAAASASFVIYLTTLGLTIGP